ncbi:restriction endonuclease subunit S, partial [Lactobacillus johnsonii]
MNKKEVKKAPALRFKGFTNDWEQRKLGYEVNFYSGLTYHPDDIRNSGVFVIRSSNIKNNRLISADNVFVNPQIVNSKPVHINDIVVVVRNGSRKLIGKHVLIQHELHDTVIGAFMTGIRSSNNFFINATLDSQLFKKEIQKNLGSTINQITVKNFQNMVFGFPSKIEKDKIGKLFRIIDNIISLQQRKL